MQMLAIGNINLKLTPKKLFFSVLFAGLFICFILFINLNDTIVLKQLQWTSTTDHFNLSFNKPNLKERNITFVQTNSSVSYGWYVSTSPVKVISKSTIPVTVTLIYSKKQC